LGIFNIDEALELKDTLYHFNFVNKNGDEVFIKQIIIVNKKNNTIYNVENINHFKCNIYDGNNILYLLDYKDKQYFCDRIRDFKIVNNKIQLKLNECTNCFFSFKQIINKNIND